MIAKKRDRFGLIDRNWQEMKAIFEQYPTLQEVFLFGSRAKGTFRKGSDIDLAIRTQPFQPQMIRKLHFDLEENTHIPYFFDVVERDSITTEALEEHLKECAVSVWKRY